MRIRVLGGGWYGAHLTAAFSRSHVVELHESAKRLFSGASGGNPARCHLGFHYPRSEKTRTACQAHAAEFMQRYGDLTRGVPTNIYAVAAVDSMVDFGTYLQVLRNRVEFVTVDRPADLGLREVEGAVLTGERHVVVDRAREFFEHKIGDHVRYGMPREVDLDDPKFDLTIDCTFAALHAANVDRYEPCVTVLLEGRSDRAVTIMDGPFPSVYPWDEDRSLSSMTSALLTPIRKDCTSMAGAQAVLNFETKDSLMERGEAMLSQMARFWPEVRDRYRIADFRLSVRAMPKSAADARLCDVARAGDRSLRVRAGKIDAIFHAERKVREAIETYWPGRDLRLLCEKAVA